MERRVTGRESPGTYEGMEEVGRKTRERGLRTVLDAWSRTVRLDFICEEKRQ